MAYFFLVDNGEHLSGGQDSINLQIGGVEVFPLFDGFLIVVALGQFLVEGFVEPVDLILHLFLKGLHLRFGQPFHMQITSSLVFY